MQRRERVSSLVSGPRRTTWRPCLAPSSYRLAPPGLFLPAILLQFTIVVVLRFQSDAVLKMTFDTRACRREGRLRVHGGRKGSSRTTCSQQGVPRPWIEMPIGFRPGTGRDLCEAWHGTTMTTFRYRQGGMPSRVHRMHYDRTTAETSIELQQKHSLTGSRCETLSCCDSVLYSYGSSIGAMQQMRRDDRRSVQYARRERRTKGPL